MPPSFNRIRGVLLDLWNTLVYSDCSPDPMEAIATALGIHNEAGWKQIIERGMMRSRFSGFREGLAAVEVEAGRKVQSGEPREELIRIWNKACAATRLFEDSMPAVRELSRRVPVGIISNTQSFDLEFLRLPEFTTMIEGVCLSCDHGMLKPDPFFFDAGVKMLGCQSGETLMIGDTWGADVEGALAAGLQSIYLDRSGRRSETRSPTPSVTSLTEVASLLT